MPRTAIYSVCARVLAMVFLFAILVVLHLAVIVAFGAGPEQQGVAPRKASQSPYPWQHFPLARYATRDADGAVTFHVRKPTTTPQPIAGYHPTEDAYRWHSLGPQWVLPRDLWSCAADLPWRESLRERPE